MNFHLRDYQLDGKQKIRQAYANGSKAVLYVLSTGAGKTPLFCDIAESIAMKNKRVIILVHRSELLDQSSAHLNKLGVDHGRIAPGYAMTGDKVQVASVHTIVRRLNKIKKPDLIIIDEAHHTVANTWHKIIQYFPHSYLLGVTATPIRLDGKGLGVNAEGYFDTLIEGPKINELIKMKYLTPAKIYAPPTPIDMSGVKIIAGDYDKKEAAIRVDKPVITGCSIDHYTRLCNGLPAIAFCQTIKHAENVAKQFNEAGIPSVSIDGKLPYKQRRYRIECLANGKIKVLTSCEIISEGTDIPVVSVIILLRPTMSLAVYLQQCGRGLRPAPQIGKIKTIILDHVGNCRIHGMVDEIRKWSLESQIKSKRSEEDTEDRARRCQNCFAMYPAYLSKCPECGQEYMTIEKKIEQVSGELIEVTKEEIDNYKKIRKAEVGAARTLDELKAIAARRDYDHKWAETMWNVRRSREKYG